MHIRKLELFHISIPFKVPYRLSKVYGTLDSAEAVILKVYTDQGLIGLGEADPMKLFSSGALKISGDLMASQKLDFLQKIDPKEAAEAVAEEPKAEAAEEAPPAEAAAGEEPEAEKAAE